MLLVSSVVNSFGLPSSGGPSLEEGIAFQKKGQLRKAEEIYRQILHGNPNNADALHLLGTIAFRAGKPDDAISLIRRAIQKEPRNPHFYNNCGPALRELGRFDEAVLCYQECLRLDPAHPEAWYNLGKTLAEASRPAEALAAYNRQIDLYPDHLSARWNRSLTKLLLGDYAAGWSEYEIRWEATPVKRRKFSSPTWNGEPLSGKTLLIHAEQGLGDTIQMLRYASLLEKLGGRVILECQPELVNLARTVRGIADVIPQGAVLTDFDFEIPAMSLPCAFGTRLESIPAENPYIGVVPEKLAHWKARIEKLPPTRKFGMVWAGGVKNPANTKRSMSLADFAPFLKIPDMEWISLQKGPAAEQASVAPFPIHDWTSEIQDFSDTAALVSVLDGVVTVDTAVAHLAGALGKPVWIMITHVPDFRWLMDRNDSPWYPSARLVRQRSRDSWKEAIETLAAELSA